MPAVRLAAIALGLHWLAATDHSCDLDETGDGAWSYATPQWEYTLQTPAGAQPCSRRLRLRLDVGGARRRDRRVRLAATAARSRRRDEPRLDRRRLLRPHAPRPLLRSRLHRLAAERRPRRAPRHAERCPTGSTSSGRTGSPSRRIRSTTSAPSGAASTGASTARAGATRMSRRRSLREAFLGIEAFNTRETRYSTDETDPWADFDAGVPPPIPTRTSCWRASRSGTRACARVSPRPAAAAQALPRRRQRRARRLQLRDLPRARQLRDRQRHRQGPDGRLRPGRFGPGNLPPSRSSSRPIGPGDRS